MSETFGARLRRQREQHGIALPTIAGHTKIKQSLLEALERDDVSQWPSGIFRRAYVRGYAQAIGLDPDAVAAEFVRVHPDPAEEVTTEAIAAALDGTRSKAGPPTRLRYIVGSALGSLTRFGRTPAPARQAERQDAGPQTLPTGLGPDLPLAVESAPEPALMAATEEMFEPLPHEVSVDMPIHAEQEEGPAPIEHVPPAPPPPDPDLAALAALCTELGRAGSAEAVQQSLQEAASVLEARGLIVWLWDRWADGLRPALAHGYADAVVAQLPIVSRDADNVTAAAFRTARPCATGGSDASGALVVPLLTSGGCAGVLAIELEGGRSLMGSVRAAATILAAQLATLAGHPSGAPDVEDEREVAVHHVVTSR